ncbi:Peroxiredoxin [Drechslerella dactyloides]|uniref:thioredoxin-dependent peroxiredoxin n=1 Tax=Drechslerella dactyloides TaxID=74499 RepID=A0AAD6NND5_DREDA|nr:Peroxiredoxin [Drechslerella dactyloides]
MTARVQQPAPVFKGPAVVDGAITDIELDNYKGRWLILGFIPMAWTFVCPTEVVAFSDATHQFTERNASIIFASVDSEYSLLAWANTARKDGGLGGCRFPLLSDKSHKISKAYGVLLEEEGIALRGLFIIDPRGVVRQITINDLPVGRSVDEVLRLIDAFTFTEKYGEVCPANWTKGQPTIQTENSKSYFSQVYGGH